MTRSIFIKIILCLGLCFTGVWFTSSGSSQSTKTAPTVPASLAKTADPSDYVGSDACKDCHEDQFKAFSRTSHAGLTNISGWKDKVTGCESCHGPGKKHIEEGDPTKMISFKNKSSKEISEACLTCHAGREERNNYRRGEHWRNDIGCTDCHSAHSLLSDKHISKSVTFVGGANAENPQFASARLLKMSEQQLCVSCHGEIKPDFNKPFHHKVLEGAMKCSDCHNPHGGFEVKQTRLATGGDAPCIKCHADKQGPFTYEHAPVKNEGCVACHTPHGSANPRMLRFSAVNQLCLTCHSVAHDVGAIEPAGPQHNQNAQYANCTACHVKIHGSRTSPVFFR